MNSFINVYTDGGARGNPGDAAVGVYISDSNSKKIAGFGKKIEVATNNVAEYKAVLEALSWVAENKKTLKIAKINFFLDSLLVYSQIVGLYKVKDSKLRTLVFAVRQKEAKINMPIFYKHIPREQNKKADYFVNAALDKWPLMWHKVNLYALFGNVDSS